MVCAALGVVETTSHPHAATSQILAMPTIRQSRHALGLGPAKKHSLFVKAILILASSDPSVSLLSHQDLRSYFKSKSRSHVSAAVFDKRLSRRKSMSATDTGGRYSGGLVEDCSRDRIEDQLGGDRRSPTGSTDVARDEPDVGNALEPLGSAR